MIADLVLRPGFALEAESTSVPANGANTFAIGIDPVNLDNEDSLVIDVIPNGPSVTAWSYVLGSMNFAFNPPEITMNFTQIGADSVRLIVRQRHTTTR